MCYAAGRGLSGGPADKMCLFGLAVAVAWPWFLLDRTPRQSECCRVGRGLSLTVLLGNQKTSHGLSSRFASLKIRESTLNEHLD